MTKNLCVVLFHHIASNFMNQISSMLEHVVNKLTVVLQRVKCLIDMLLTSTDS